LALAALGHVAVDKLVVAGVGRLVAAVVDKPVVGVVETPVAAAVDKDKAVVAVLIAIRALTRSQVRGLATASLQHAVHPSHFAGGLRQHQLR